MYHQYKDLHEAVKSKKSSENKKAEVLWAMEKAKDKGVNCCHTSHKKSGVHHL